MLKVAIVGCGKIADAHASQIRRIKGCEIVGVFWGEFIRRHPERLRAQIKSLLQWVHEGRLSAHVDATYPFERAVEAFAAIGARKVKGKVLLKPKV